MKSAVHSSGRTDVSGNDDGGVKDEISDPYVNKIQNRNGAITSSDAPAAPLIRRASGVVGDKIELMIQFREFVRMNIGGTWIRISKFVTWRFDSKIKKSETGEWVDDGSVTDNTNDGW